MLYRPREKALYHGIGSLNEVELLALIIEQGTKDANALTLAKTLLERFINLANLYRIKDPRLLMIKGIGKAKALKLLAVFELNKRLVYTESEMDSFQYNQDKIIRNYQVRIGRLPKEHMYLIALNKRKTMIFEKRLYIGNERGLELDTKEIIRELLLVNAVYFVLIHNHPSGSTLPSKSDIIATETLLLAARKFNLTLLDHIIVSPNDYMSLRDFLSLNSPSSNKN